jgi:hypothetical protein
MSLRGFWALLLMIGMLSGSLCPFPTAEAHRRGSYHRYYDQRRQPLVDYKTGKIIKGGLIGAGIGAGTGLLMDGNVGRNAVIGAGLGAGTQALRYSSTMRRHPIVKTAGYGALSGVGVSALTRRGSLGKGAAWGGLAGAGLGALQRY